MNSKPPETTAQETLTNTKKVVSESLEIVEQTALKRPANWKEIKKETLLMIGQASTDKEVYEALAWCLASLRDSHSFLLDPAKKPIRATRLVKDRRLIFHEGRSKYTKQKIEANEIDYRQTRIGYIYVPSYNIYTNHLSESNFAQLIQNKLGGLAKRNVTGWIVDLRGNAGGNMWPMMAGLGPLMSGPKIGAWVNSSETADWMYEDGEAYQKNTTRRKTNAKCMPKLKPISESVPVGVLIDRFTASSGEAAAICFSGRKNTKFFGETTWGVATANGEYKLNNGAVIYLTIAYDVDRNGKSFKNGVEPDFAVSDEEKTDKALETAQKWLVEQFRKK